MSQLPVDGKLEMFRPLQILNEDMDSPKKLPKHNATGEKGRKRKRESCFCFCLYTNLILSHLKPCPILIHTSLCVYIWMDMDTAQHGRNKINTRKGFMKRKWMGVRDKWMLKPLTIDRSSLMHFRFSNEILPSSFYLTLWIAIGWIRCNFHVC